MGCKFHDIGKAAGSQTNNISSKHKSMTSKFCKNIYQKIYLDDLASQEIQKYKKNLKLGGDNASAQSPF